MFNKKQFGHLRLSGLSLLLSILLVGVFGFSTAYSQVTIDTVGTQAKKAIQLDNTKTLAKQSPVVIPDFKIAVSDTLTITSDSVAIGLTNTNFVFAQKGPYKVTVQGAIRADSARVNAAGDSLYIKISGPVGYSDADTLTVSGVYVTANTSSSVYSDSTTTDFLSFAVGQKGSLTATAHPGTKLILLPGSIYQAFVDFPAKYDTTITAGATFGAIVHFEDAFGNTPYDKSTKVTATAIQPNSTSPGNGVLTPGSITYDVSDGHPGKDIYQWNSMSYSKAEDIQLQFSPAGGKSDTSLVLHFVPNTTVANISVTGKATTTSVDGSIDYTITATDANFNPVQGATVTASEKTPHGGTFSAIATTDTNGVTTTTFTPSKYYTGSDVLVFTSSSASQSVTITITPGAVGGIIADYASGADSAAVGTPSSGEKIAAGVTVYVRGFLRDTYGNPISATSASSITFTTANKLSGHSTPGSSALTSAVTEDQYQNTNKTAVGVAASFSVYSKVGKYDSVTVAYGSFSQLLVIQNRSNVPTTLKLVQNTGSGNDSSIVASKYTNNITYLDSAWDAYGNLVSDPGKVTVAPTQSSYNMYFSAKLAELSNKMKVDTLLPSSTGVYTETVYSDTASGVDTLKSWSAASSSVAKNAPFWVTPDSYAKLAIIPPKVTTAIAGQTTSLTVEKLDQYGNHIDWGLTGGQQRGNTGKTLKPTTAQMNADSTALTVDTVKTGHNRGGYVTIPSPEIVGKAGVASIGGTLNATFKFTSYTAGADTQKVYASLYSQKDTATIYSAPTGALAGFTVDLKATGSDKLTSVPAGDSVMVTITAIDSNGHRIYTYAQAGQTLTVNHTMFTPITSKDTTYYFTYQNSKGNWVIKTTGASLTDTVFNQGQAVFYLHKFRVDSTNTVSITNGTFTNTSSSSITYKPLSAYSSYGYWAVTVPSTLQPNGPFAFTVTPRDMYYNISYTPTNIICNIAANQVSSFNVGSNPKVINGPQTFTGVLTNAKDSLIIYVFNSSNNAIYGQSIVARVQAVSSFAVSGMVTYGDGTQGVKNVVVTLTPGGMTDTTDATGAFSFANVANGTYTVTASTSNMWLGADATDALQASRYYNGVTKLSAIQQMAADVNNNGQVNNTDALLIVRRYIQLDSSFAAGDWVFSSTKVTVNGTPVTADLQGLVTGDVNESDSTQLGTLKRAQPTVDLASEGVLNVNGKDEFVVPVKISGNANISALSLRFTYPQDMATFVGASSKVSMLANGANGKIAVGWADLTGKNELKLQDGQSIVDLKFKPTENFKKGAKFDITLVGDHSELAKADGSVLDNSKLNAPTVEVNIPKAFALRQNYPNPFNPSTIIEYDLPVKGNVSLIIYNILGQKVATLVHEVQDAGTYKFNFNADKLASGAYIYRLEVQGDNGKSFSQVNKMLLLK